MEVTTFCLDCTQMCTRQQAHEYMRTALGLPAYYGKNLDALFDCLAEMPACRIVLRHTAALECLEAYGKALLGTFREAAAENARITLEEEL